MHLDIPAVIVILIFYALITVVGVWAAKVTKNRKSKNASDTMIVGGKDIGLFVGVCTITATWVGGGAINGTAETTYSRNVGLVWCVITVCYGLSLLIAGLCFAKKMREENYLTVMDAFEKKLGKYFALFYFCIEAFGSAVFTAGVLNALGGTIEVIAGMNRTASIILSAGIATLYTLLGGIYSVAFTDVIQLSFIFLGLVFVIPFAITNEAVTSISDSFVKEDGWSGSLDSSEVGRFIDAVLLPLFGGAPVQTAFQRFLSIDTTKNAQIVGVMGAVLSCILVIPPVLIGAIGASTNWTLTSYMNGTGISPADMGNERQILPIVIEYLTPTVVGYIGLGVITAAVMSSADSAALAFGSQFGRNCYHSILRPKASQNEVVWAIRGSIVVFVVVATTVAIQSESIMTLYVLASDLVYVLTWPEFLCSIHLDTNGYGTLAGIIVGVTLRVGGGEYRLGIPSPFNFSSKLPIKTIAMIGTFMSTVIVSRIMKFLFINYYVPARYDILRSNLSGKNRKENITNSTTAEALTLQETSKADHSDTFSS